MEGFVEFLAEHQVGGWAFDAAHPNRHLLVTAYFDGEQIGAAIASLPRADLRLAGIGAGDHGFELTFRQPIAPTLLSRIEVRSGDPEASIVLEVLRRSNHSMVDQASNALIPFADTEQHPVFVLGPARSGTSAVALALLKSGRYEGHGEGHLLPLARDLTSMIDFYYANRTAVRQGDTLLRAVHIDAFQRMVRRGFVQLTRATFPTGYWIDKTPTVAMVRAVPLLREIWRNARFIFLKRRVIENVLSRRRKFPEEKLEHHYGDWAGVLAAWLSVRGTLGDTAIEVDQMDLARRGDEVAAAIARFLDMPAPFAEAFRAALAADHPEQTSEAFGEAATLDSLNLSAADRPQFMATCDPIMEAYGYSYDGSYYRNRSVAAW